MHINNIRRHSVMCLSSVFGINYKREIVLKLKVLWFHYNDLSELWRSPIKHGNIQLKWELQESHRGKLHMVTKWICFERKASLQVRFIHSQVVAYLEKLSSLVVRWIALLMVLASFYSDMSIGSVIGVQNHQKFRDKFWQLKVELIHSVQRPIIMQPYVSGVHLFAIPEETGLRCDYPVQMQLLLWWIELFFKELMVGSQLHLHSIGVSRPSLAAIMRAAFTENCG